MSEHKNLTEKKEEAIAGSSTTNAQLDKKPLPKLGALEDDDEFEDFPATDYGGNIQDALKKAAAGPSDNLWEDNWDDDDVDDDFTKQLRTAIQVRANAAADETMKE
ncbi:26S proteasome complex subunit DSS1 [Cryptococcus deuterogattii 99/473]|uniref:26S proteasome complex subunit SEM1 n=2 Tax=Cryptococcus deuterogattii TaxID=1859096 RepID=A0A0D0V0N6_9TREE|nr:26S proteasome complex subunit DSS1 [Cryptococcus deuterogattii R265]KIR27451.1 26S proteasome complex subunit DSS1 [Cryptococcus deuterogattii LA55]KIR38480.1 26S proteasome complex subunit DSS1 [Cryptococcus deuterogattii Ram5]KIR70467.1 26S proteasome complex subunit DSS1 [Cryptococcus deuterogattii CA1014]KIR90328.1 26S proteasome complex subunit DSS1 [Cryptococcus deuterogattii CBS 10090]KIR97016.1 26S proteasome complex subunit DSS1 [Cryptococcus deuterogattii 2001/935-1]KIY55100.1 2